MPRNVVLRVLLVVLAAVVWVGLGVGKVVLYGAGALLFVAASLVELVAELAIMPFVLLARLVGTARWPVEIARQGKHFATKYAPDLAEAAILQDELVTQLEGGTPPEQHAGSGDSKPGSVGRLED